MVLFMHLVFWRDVLVIYDGRSFISTWETPGGSFSNNLSGCISATVEAKQLEELVKITTVH